MMPNIELRLSGGTALATAPRTTTYDVQPIAVPARTPRFKYNPAGLPVADNSRKLAA